MRLERLVDRTRLLAWRRAPETTIFLDWLAGKLSACGDKAMRIGVGADEIERLRGEHRLIRELLDEAGLLGELERHARRMQGMGE